MGGHDGDRRPCGPPGGEQESQGGRRQCSGSSGHLTWLLAPTYRVSIAASAASQDAPLATRLAASNEGRAMCQVWPRVAEVWPGCGRSTAGALCAAAELHTARGPAKGQYAPASGLCGRSNCCGCVPRAHSAVSDCVWPKCGRSVADVWPQHGRRALRRCAALYWLARRQWPLHVR